MGLQIVQLMNNSASPVAINSMTVGSGSTVTSTAIDTSRAKYAGVYLIHTGTVNAITRKVGMNTGNLFTPFDKTASLANLLATSANNSRFVALEQINSATIVAPYTQFAFTMLSGGTLTVLYVSDEDGV